MTEIGRNIERLRSEMPQGVKIVAVSKFHPVESLMQAYDAGQRAFGENRAQELVGKVGMMPGDVSWHFIGKLQKNKVRMVVRHVSLIQSIDSEALLRLVDAEAARAGRVVDVLLELHVAREETKSGFSADEMLALQDCSEIAALRNVRVCGLMAMASFVEDARQIEREFGEARSMFERLRCGMFAGRDEFAVLSMGMSDDWRIAVDCGSTMVRIGTTIFGAREY